MFDREGDDGKFVSVTVKATDQGEPSLEGVCSFTVEITDVNDNPPLFDRQVRIFGTFGQTPRQTLREPFGAETRSRCPEVWSSVAKPPPVSVRYASTSVTRECTQCLQLLRASFVVYSIKIYTPFVRLCARVRCPYRLNIYAKRSGCKWNTSS